MMTDPNTPQPHDENKPALTSHGEEQRFLPSAMQSATQKKPLQPITRTEEKIGIAKNVHSVFQVAAIGGVFLVYGGFLAATPALILGGLAVGMTSYGISAYAKAMQKQHASALLVEEDLPSSIQLLLETPEQTKWAVQNLAHVQDFTQRYYQLNAMHILTAYHRPTHSYARLQKNQADMYTFRKYADVANLQPPALQNEEYKRLHYVANKTTPYVAFFEQHFHDIFTQMPRNMNLLQTKRSQNAFAFTFAYLRLLAFMGAPAYLFTADLIGATWAKASARYRGKNGFMPLKDDAILGKAEAYYHTFLQVALKYMQNYSSFQNFFSNFVSYLLSQVPSSGVKRNDELRHLSAAALFSACVLNTQVDKILFKDSAHAINYGGLPALQFYLQRNPRESYSTLRMYPAYANHFLTSAKQGLAVLREQHLNTSYFTQLSFFQDPSTFHIPVAVSVHDLPKDTRQRFLNVLQAFRAALTPHVQKNLRTAEQKLSFSVWLAGYACFFADVLTPTVDLGPQFLQAYLQDLQKELYIPPAQIPQFLELFQKAFFCFAEPAEAVFTAGDVPTILESYAQLFMASAGVASTLLPEYLRNQTAALLPACEMALQPDDL